jgi:hypothetical protein
MTHPKPTRQQLGEILQATDLKTYNLLLQILREARPPNEPLDTATITRLALYDWMTSMNVLSIIDRQQLLLNIDLSYFVDAYENAQPSIVLQPRDALVILDFRYVLVTAAWHAKAPMYFDLQEGMWVKKPAVKVMTMLSCELSVLLKRLFDRIDRIVKQERTDATTGTPTDG